MNRTFLVIIICYALCLGCKSQVKNITNEFDKVIYEERDAESYTILEITKDSISFKEGLNNPKTKKVKKRKTQPDIWKRFVSSISLKDFQDIKSLEQNPYHKNSLVSVTLYQGKKEYKYKNG